MASIELSFIDYPKVTIDSKKELLVKIREESGELVTQKKIKKGVVDLKVPVLREWIVEVSTAKKKFLTTS